MNSPQQPGAARLATALFLLSLAAVLFSLCVFRLISFFIMPSLFFDLLLICFPVGAALAMTRHGEAFERFRRALPLLQIAMAATIGATLTLKHFDFMRQNLLFGASPWGILMQIVIFAAIYCPFFAAYGATEYLGYLAGRAVLTRKMRGVYAVVLFGAAAAFLVSLLQPTLGIARLLLISLALLTIVKLAIGGDGAGRRWLELALLVGLLLTPQTDAFFMRWFKSSKFRSVAWYKAQFPCRELYAGWGRYAYFEVLRYKTDTETVNVGFYNDMSQWNYRPGPIARGDFRDAVLQPLVQGAQSVAVIGAGGGRDVKLARSVGVKRIVALEVEPIVPKVIQGPLREEFENVYNRDDVRVVVGDARTYLENAKEQFDVIFFWSVGGYPQLMLEPGNMIRTTEALGAFLDRLSDRGFFYLGYDHALDPDRVLLQQYATTLRGHGAEVVGFEKTVGDVPIEYALVAFSPRTSAAQKQKWRDVIATIPRVDSRQSIRRLRSEELKMEDFRPVTDNQPYLAGNIRNVLSPRQVRTLFVEIGGGLGLLCIVVYSFAVGRPAPGTRLNGKLQLLAFLLGANFLVLEHLCVLEIFQRRYIYYDAVVLGVTAFLTITAAGSLILPARWLKTAVLASWLGPIIWLAMLGSTTPWIALPALVLGTLVTGAMFPTLFERHESSRLSIFALDAIGAAVGAMFAFFVPILFGIAVFRMLALVLFLATGAAMVALGQTDSESVEAA